jgi:hypothetical protein
MPRNEQELLIAIQVLIASVQSRSQASAAFDQFGNLQERINHCIACYDDPLWPESFSGQVLCRSFRWRIELVGDKIHQSAV